MARTYDGYSDAEFAREEQEWSARDNIEANDFNSFNIGIWHYKGHNTEHYLDIYDRPQIRLTDLQLATLSNIVAVYVGAQHAIEATWMGCHIADRGTDGKGRHFQTLYVLGKQISLYDDQIELLRDRLLDYIRLLINEKSDCEGNKDVLPVHLEEVA